MKKSDDIPARQRRYMFRYLIKTQVKNKIENQLEFCGKCLRRKWLHGVVQRKAFYGSGGKNLYWSMSKDIKVELLLFLG